MSMEEVSEILAEARKLRKAGNEEEAIRLQMSIPLDPGYADDIKRFEGLEFLIEGGFNLTDAVDEFGEEWLHE